MDDAHRAELHQRLDEILDRRSVLDPPANLLGALSGFATTAHCNRAQARGVLRLVVTLARDILGGAVRGAAFDRFYSKDCEQRPIVRQWLFDLWPIIHATPSAVLGIAPQRELTIFEVLDGLSALDAGEIRPVFVANTGKNRRANRWSLARTKLEALVWKKRLLALGYGEKAANFQVTLVFGEQWDTVRKWGSQCEDILGVEYVTAQLDYAGSPADIYTKARPDVSSLFAHVPQPDPLQSLAAAGAAYRRELQRSSELSKRKSRAVA